MMKLFLADGQEFAGNSFGSETEATGEVVFTTGMTGYLEVLTDPSYFGQIVVFTFPLIGNYGVPNPKNFKNHKHAPKVDKVFESPKIWVRGVIIAEESLKYSHADSVKNFQSWLKEQNIPAISGVDTRQLTQILREHGTILGKLGKSADKKYIDELDGRFVPFVSPQIMEIMEPENSTEKTIAFVDCGAKNGIFRHFLNRGIRIIRVPFNQNPFELNEKFDGIFLSNGPGDPDTMTETIEIAREAIHRKIPTFGICLGCQMLGLASGGKTKKMKYGHRGVNQPVRDKQSGRCLITTQNHGFMVDEKSLAKDWEVWFENLNDGTVEGIRHKTLPIFATQFHPEACAGPEDAEYLFDIFIEQL
jgi:carbamoyl-phosphate synthase small subunit